MKVLLLILASVIPMLEAAGASLEADVQHPEKVLIGEALVAGGQLIQFAIDKLNNKAATPPAIPDSLNASAARAAS